jgi:hypothetical protein
MVLPKEFVMAGYFLTTEIKDVPLQAVFCSVRKRIVF